MKGIDDSTELTSNQMANAVGGEGKSPRRRRMDRDMAEVLNSSPKRYNRVVEALGAYTSPASSLKGRKMEQFGGDLVPGSGSNLEEALGRVGNALASPLTSSGATVNAKEEYAPVTPTRRNRQEDANTPERSRGNMAPVRLFDTTEHGETNTSSGSTSAKEATSARVAPKEKQAWDVLFSSPKRPPRVYDKPEPQEEEVDDVYERIISLPLKWEAQSRREK